MRAVHPIAIVLVKAAIRPPLCPGSAPPAHVGGAESLVTQPCTTTHHGLPPEERQRRGISDSLLRLSVGLEDTEDLLADLDQALR